MFGQLFVVVVVANNFAKKHVAQKSFVCCLAFFALAMVHPGMEFPDDVVRNLNHFYQTFKPETNIWGFQQWGYYTPKWMVYN
jgi:hypothetical protein